MSRPLACWEESFTYNAEQMSHSRLMIVIKEKLPPIMGQWVTCYSLTAFNERATFWFQLVWSQPCAYACVVSCINHHAIAHAYDAANTHAQGSDWTR